MSMQNKIRLQAFVIGHFKLLRSQNFNYILIDQKNQWINFFNDWLIN